MKKEIIDTEVDEQCANQNISNMDFTFFANKMQRNEKRKNEQDGSEPEIFGSDCILPKIAIGNKNSRKNTQKQNHR